VRLREGPRAEWHAILRIALKAAGPVDGSVYFFERGAGAGAGAPAHAAPSWPAAVKMEYAEEGHHLNVSFTGLA
jgi:hypothetical protein